ncbi:hypothetical protein ACHAW6_012588 [Cyclotella cf. meneghiniana]
MLPVIGLHGIWTLDIKLKVLDLCTSPGSKMLQALKVIGSRRKVIANEVHPGRLDTLHEAEVGLGRLFDAVICYMPYGKDGTIYKDLHVLSIWSGNISNLVHAVQLRIILQALQLVKVGGIVCYSTCCMNLIKDEAVIATALRSRTGSMCDGGHQWQHNVQTLGLAKHLAYWSCSTARSRSKNNDKDDDDCINNNDSLDGLLFFESYESTSASGVGGDILPMFWINMA